MATKELESITQLVEKSSSIAVLTHVNPDGDAVGSLFALGKGLQKRFPDKKIFLTCTSPIPETYGFLPCDMDISKTLGPQNLVISLNTSAIKVENVTAKEENNKFSLTITPKIGVFTPDDLECTLSSPCIDLVIVLDCGSFNRIGALYEENKEFLDNLPVINIDHHAENTYFGSINLVDTSASATAQILYRLFLSMNIPFDKEIATFLLTGIITDTGNFQYSNTTPETLMIASKLMQEGAEHQKIVEQLYRMKKYSTLKLWGSILTKIEHSADEKIIWTTVTREDITKNQSTFEEAEGVIDELMLSTPRAEIILLFYENDETVRVSIRTVEGINASILAEAFGGGGHRRAAGFRCKNKKIGEVVENVVKEVENIYTEGKAHETPLHQDIPPKNNLKPTYSPEDVIRKIGLMLEGESPEE